MKKIYIYIILSAFIFATMEVSLKISSQTLDPLQITFLRFFLGGIVLLIPAIFEFKKKEGREILKPRNFFFVVFLGILLVPIDMVLFQIGVNYLNAGTSAVLFCSNPIFICIFAHFFTTEKFNPIKIVAILFGVVGICLLAVQGIKADESPVMGIIIILSASVLFGLYSVLQRKAAMKIGIYQKSAITFLSGSIALLIVMLFMQKPVVAGFSENIVIILYASVIVTAGGYFFFFLASKEGGPTKGSTVFFLKPIIAPFIAFFVLNESFGIYKIGGVLFVVVASALLLFYKKKN